MKKCIITSIIAISLIVIPFYGCTVSDGNVENKSADIANAENTDTNNADVENYDLEEPIALDNGSPWVNSDLKENIYPDKLADPKDDFHLYASMDWLSKAEIPEGHSSYTLYDQCAAITKEKAIKMFNEDDFEDTSHNEQLAKQLYDLYKDTKARDKDGVEPIREMSERYLAVETLADLDALLTDEYLELMYPSPISVGVGTGLEDTSTNLCWIDGMDFILGDAAEYANRTEYGDILYNYRKDIFVYVMGRLGMDAAEAAERFDDAISIETTIAKVSLTQADALSAAYYEKINNAFSYDEAMDRFKNYPIKEIIDVLKLKYDGTYMLGDLESIAAIDKAYTEENAKSFANLMLVNFIRANANYLDEETRAQVVEYYNKYFGTSGDAPIDERAYMWVASLLPEQTSQAFVKRYSSDDDKERIENICYQAIDVYKEMLSENEWVSEATKKAAIEKLDALSVYVGWPDKWNDYSDLNISGDSFFEANSKIKYVSAKKEMQELGKRVDKSDWAKGENLLECNAFYTPSTNSMLLMVGMMNEPFYWPDMSTEELYASLGAFWIGHEISHAFDSNGAQWDKDGNYSDWWTEEDKAEFNKRVDKFVDYLDTIRIMGDYYVKGSNVDTEMVADIIGVKCALKMAEKEENFDYKKFFEFYSDMNSGVTLYSNMIAMINGDPHPLNYLRANVPIQQFEEFYETYDVKEGDNMYLAPEKRLALW